MLKIRLQGTIGDIQWFRKILDQTPEIQVTEFSRPYTNKGTNRFYTIENTAEVQKHQMKDDVTKVEISKQDIAGKEIPGAKLIIYDADGKVVESWTSTTEPHYIEMLKIGKYTLHEETAPDGYLVANDVEFEVKDTAEVQHVTMVDEAKPSNPSEPGTPDKSSNGTPKTGDDRNIMVWITMLASYKIRSTLGSFSYRFVRNTNYSG